MKKIELRRRILSQFNTLADFAKHIDSSPSLISLEIGGQKDMRASRMMLYARVLGIEQEEFGRFFFPDAANNSHIRLYEALMHRASK